MPDDGDEPGPGPCGGPGGEQVGTHPGQGGRDRTVQDEGGTAGGGEVGGHPDGGRDGAGAFASDRDHRAVGEGIGVRPAVGARSGAAGPRGELVQDGGCPGGSECADAGQLPRGCGAVGDEDKPLGLELGDPPAQFAPGVLAVANREGEVRGTGLDPPVQPGTATHGGLLPFGVGGPACRARRPGRLSPGARPRPARWAGHPGRWGGAAGSGGGEVEAVSRRASAPRPPPPTRRAATRPRRRVRARPGRRRAPPRRSRTATAATAVRRGAARCRRVPRRA